jgi:hypothetical protein
VGVLLMAREVCALVNDVPIPAQAEPFQSFEDRASAFFRAPGAVGVFYAEEEGASVFSCVQPVEQRCTGTADMEIAGW